MTGSKNTSDREIERINKKENIEKRERGERKKEEGDRERR